MMVIPETDYTPETVERLLRQLPYRKARQGIQGFQFDPDPVRGGMREQRWAGFEDEQISDIEAALATLPQPTYQVVYLRFVGGKSLREVGVIVGVNKDTVRHHSNHGVKMMAWTLGWRDASEGWI